MTGRRAAPRVLLLPLLLGLHPSVLAAQDVGAACDSVARLTAMVPDLRTTRTDTVVEDPRTGRSGPGCQLRARGRTTAFGAGPTLDLQLRTALPDQGWREDNAYAADGPDGTAFAFRRGEVICFFRGSWDGGDDGDPSYVPDDRYELVVDCTKAPPGHRPGPGNLAESLRRLHRMEDETFTRPTDTPPCPLPVVTARAASHPTRGRVARDPPDRPRGGFWPTLGCCR